MSIDEETMGKLTDLVWEAMESLDKMDKMRLLKLLIVRVSQIQDKKFNPQNN